LPASPRVAHPGRNVNIAPGGQTHITDRKVAVEHDNFEQLAGFAAGRTLPAWRQVDTAGHVAHLEIAGQLLGVDARQAGKKRVGEIVGLSVSRVRRLRRATCATRKEESEKSRPESGRHSKLKM
jgi:hypothetical protein